MIDGFDALDFIDWGALLSSSPQEVVTAAVIIMQQKAAAPIRYFFIVAVNKLCYVDGAKDKGFPGKCQKICPYFEIWPLRV